MSFEDCSPKAMKDLGSQLLSANQRYLNWTATYNLCMKESNVDCTPLKKEAEDHLFWSQYLQLKQTKCTLFNKYTSTQN